MGITPERLLELDAKHGRIAHVKSNHLVDPLADVPVPRWEVVLRKPNRAEYKAFRAMAPKSPDAQENLVRQIMVEPEGATAIDALINDWPGIPEACTEALYQLTGMTAEELGK